MGAVRERARLTMTPPCSPDSTSAAPPTSPARCARPDDDADDGDEALAAVSGDPRRRPRAGRRGRPRAHRPVRRRATSTTSGCPPPTCRPRCDAIPAELRDGARDRRRRGSGSTTRTQADVAEPVLDRDGVSLREVAVPGRPGRSVRARRPGRLPVDRADDRHPGAGRRRRRDRAVRAARPADGRRARRHPGRRRARRGRRGVPHRRRPGDRRAGVRHRVDPAGRRDRRARATSTSRWPSARSRARSAIDVASPGRPRWWSSPTTPSPATFAAADLLAQAEHGPGGSACAGHVGRGGGRRRRRRGRRACSPTSPRRAEIEATLASGGHAVLVDEPEQADGGRQRDRPRAPRAACPPTPSARPARAQRRRGVRRAVGARRRRRLRRRREPRAARPTAPPGSPSALARRRLPQARPRRARSSEAGLAAARAARRRARRGRGPRRPRRRRSPPERRTVRERA